MNFHRLITVTLLSAFLLGSISFGADLSPAQENEAKEIENLLIAPCCWRQPVSVHPSAASDEIKVQIREMLAAGMGRDEIVQKYVAEYGERILAKPPAEGFASLAYFLPAIFLIAGAIVALLVIRKLRPSGVPPEPSAAAASAASRSDYSAKLDKELWG
jgi:cytochrome c-type biogenesis protein CcmH